MTRGKKTCKILKEIRQQIAENNDIEYITSECNFQGECKGTCPKCESEVRYLENELNKRRQLGKVVTIAGISLGVAGSFSACNNPRQENIPISEQQDTVEIVKQDTMEMDTILSSPILKKTKGDEMIIDIIGDIPIEIDVMPEEPIEMDGYVHFGEIDAESFDTTSEDICLFPEISPEYPGKFEALESFLKENIVYPEDARKKGIEGKIFVNFVVETDGSITNVKIIRAKHPSLDKEAIRVVEMMPKWKPGEQKGKKVRVKYTLPINFNLDE